MVAFVQLAAVVVLGLIVSWLAGRWLGLFNNIYAGTALGLAVIFLIAWMVDRRSARRQRQSQETRRTD